MKLRKSMKPIAWICLIITMMWPHNFIFGAEIDSLFNQGNEKYSLGEYELAIARYEKLVKNPKYAGEANFRIAEAYRLSNRTKEAKPYYEAAIKSKYRGEEAYYYLAYSLKANGDYSGADMMLF